MHRTIVAPWILGLWLVTAMSPGRSNARQDAVPGDRVARLQEAIDAGRTELSFDPEHGYLPALLEEFSIPVSSQVLPFGRSSFQIFQISPETPRAIYFSDDVYIGRVLGVPVLELAAVDPGTGPVFYTLDEEPGNAVRFEPDTGDCILCHDSSRTPGLQVPRLLLLSVLPDENGAALGRAALSTTDRSPFRERWGGWYVTGTHGGQYHLGNRTVRPGAVELDPVNNTIDIRREIADLDLADGANVTGLGDRFDTSRYLTPHSDIVALMVLGHQTHVLNLIARANYEATTPERIEESVESLLDAMLFVGEVPLEDPIRGTSSFARDFQNVGPMDGDGRSLRDLDLERRLFRYPLSFLIHADAFDGLAAPVRERVVRRLFDVLEGRETGERFAHLEAEDRTAILEILAETKPGLQARLNGDREASRQTAPNGRTR